MFERFRSLDYGHSNSPAHMGFLHLARMVFWSFLGIRKQQDLESDAAEVTPVQVIVAGVMGAMLLVLCLLSIVWFVTS